MKLAILGTGMIVGEALTALKSVDAIEVNAVYGRSREKAERLAAEHSIGLVFDDYDELLSSERIDFVYIGLTNSVHYEFALRALQAGKNVIVEKPFATSASEAEEIAGLARAKGLYVFEAVTPLHSGNFKKVREILPTLGRLRAVQANYSQYSSRYDRYLAGDVAPAFDPKKFGGALADINIYNLNVIIGLLGEPRAVEYAANIGFNGVDTSGVVLMKYDGLIATALGAKDSGSPSFVILQGEKGWLRVNGAPNEFKSFDVSVGGTVEHYELNRPEHRMADEFEEFAAVYAAGDFERMSGWLDVSISVMRTVERAKKSLEAD